MRPKQLDSAIKVLISPNVYGFFDSFEFTTNQGHDNRPMKGMNNMSNAAKMSAVETPKGRKKLTVQKIDIANEKSGFSFKGKFVGTAQGEAFKQVDQNTGEITEKTLTFAIFADLETGDRFKVTRDKGLASAMSDALIKEGDVVEIVKLEKMKLKGSKTMNQYDIYSLN